MEHWKKKCMFAVLVLVMVLVSACGGAGTDGGTDGRTSGAEGGTEETVELTFWMNWREGSAYTGMYYDKVQQFKQAHPEINLIVEEIPYVDYNVRLQTAAAGSQLPDIFQFISGGPMLQVMARSGSLQPYDDDFVAEWKDVKIPASMLTQFEIDGKQYGIPSEANYGSIVFYNKDILASVGYAEFPTQFSELIELIIALKENGVTPITVGNVQGEILANSFFSIMADRMYGPGSLQAVADGNASLTDEPFVTALEKLKEMADVGAFNVDANTIETIESVNRFLDGDAAIVVDGSWTISQILQGDPAFEVGVAVFPEIEGGNGQLMDLSVVTNQAVVMNSALEGKKKEAAKQFIRFVFDEELYNILTERSFPVTAQHVITIPESASQLFKDMMDLTNDVNSISATFENVMPAQAKTEMFNLLQGLIIQGVTPEQVAERVQNLLK